MKKNGLIFLLLAWTAVSCLSVVPISTEDAAMEQAKPAREGALSGEFSIAKGKKVHFSKGNLQYQASTNTWRFAEHQWDIVGEANSNISPTYDGWIDLFGWGTSGYHDTLDPQNVNYHPWSADSQKVRERMVYEEWMYLFNFRKTDSGIRFAKAIVNNVNGWIVLPDDWNEKYYNLEKTNWFKGEYDKNIITDKQWIILEQHGAVFLPAAGFRINTTVHESGILAGYWSATPFRMGRSGSQSWLFPSSCESNRYIEKEYYRCNGLSVRLVTPVK